MIRCATDENFDGRILAGLQSRLPELDVIRVQDTAFYQASDPKLLAWLAKEHRVLLFHDVRTMPGFVYNRVNAGLTVAGVIEVHTNLALAQAIDELTWIIEVGTPKDFENLVRYIPL